MYVINYATESHKHLQKRCTASCTTIGLKVFEYDTHFLRNTEFYIKHQNILDQEYGAGYWLWKPFLIYYTMGLINEGETILYLDSHHFIKTINVIPFISDRLDQGIFATLNRGKINKSWTKRDCFILMDCDGAKYWDTDQTEAGQIAFCKNSFTLKFIEEWIKYGIDPRIITDSLNTQGKPNFESFIWHRWDQSILTNLLIKYGIKRTDLFELQTYIQDR